MSEATTEKRLLISRYQRRGKHFIENLSDEIGLDMVLIPGGKFLMGAPEDELESRDYERPQHEVTVPSFLMGRYPITQSQWRIVANWTQVKRSLNPEPSNFQGDSRPVEQVSWEEAVEFCQRLSAKTGRTYRLPSEAEWEYACRAGTQTPFYFGETLGDELANYCAQDEKSGDTLFKGAYGRGIEGTYRKETTEVGIFPPNNFGLHDMHGNVFEWCEDDWHDSYEGAVEDGRAWLEPNATDTLKLLRGGCWYGDPRYCRSACRSGNARDGRYFYIGFRVCCVLPRTLLST
jgi:formylglycine-generating enzyme required for sulfatase activity